MLAEWLLNVQIAIMLIVLLCKPFDQGEHCNSTNRVVLKVIKNKYYEEKHFVSYSAEPLQTLLAAWSFPEWENWIHWKQLHYIYVTGFWKISLDVTVHNSNIYEQNEEQGHPTKFTVVTI